MVPFLVWERSANETVEHVWEGFYAKGKVRTLWVLY